MLHNLNAFYSLSMSICRFVQHIAGKPPPPNVLGVLVITGSIAINLWKRINQVSYKTNISDFYSRDISETRPFLKILIYGSVKQ